jgi:hypothetical protein
MRTNVTVTDRTMARAYLEDALEALADFDAADPEHAWALDVRARRMALEAAKKLQQEVQ